MEFGTHSSIYQKRKGVKEISFILIAKCQATTDLNTTDDIHTSLIITIVSANMYALMQLHRIITEDRIQLRGMMGPPTL